MKLNAEATGCHIAYAFHVDATTRDTLEQLRFKYGEMLSMRLVHESGEEDPAQARQRMASLAAQFPGALREIDGLELAVIRERIRRLDAVLLGEAAVERWMHAVGLFHTLARGALHAKRWLAGRKSIDSATLSAYESDLGARPGNVDALAWMNDLARVAAPPRGRLMDVVFARLARTLGTTEVEARRLVFGPPRRSRT
jgi:hypothetical protein